MLVQPSPVSLAPGTLDPKGLMVFREPSGFSTTDLYDAHDRVIQFTSSGELALVAGGTLVPGFAMSPDSAHWGPPTYFIGFATGKCADFCVFSVRFGTAGGRRRAFLTIDYGHSNPGTLVDVEVVGGALVVTQPTRYQTASKQVTLTGDLRFDIQLARR
jgi:hypothetical protein